MADTISIGSGQKISFGVFASFSSDFMMRGGKPVREFTDCSASAFRTLGLVQPDREHILSFKLKTEGFSATQLAITYFQTFL